MDTSITRKTPASIELARTTAITVFETCAHADYWLAEEGDYTSFADAIAGYRANLVITVRNEGATEQQEAAAIAAYYAKLEELRAIERDAELSAEYGDADECHHAAGSAERRIWMAAYKRGCRQYAEDLDASYADAMEREDDRIFRNCRTPL